MEKVIKRFKNLNIVVIGDVMLDKYIWGDVERVSPEAPIQILDVNEETFVPGGAANVANNISVIGAGCSLIGIVGKDEARKKLEKELHKRGIKSYLIEDERPTIQKVRLIAQNQQLLRVDYEDRKYIEKHVEKEIIDRVKKTDKIDGIIISDYQKGLITSSLIQQLREFASDDIPIIVDPKPKHLDYYRDVTLITPNLKEAQAMTGIEGSTDKDVELMGEYLIKKLNCSILITRGAKGMSVFEKNSKAIHIPTKAKEVYDVSGAGDTVAAAIALAITSGADMKMSADIANHAAGIVVGKVGTSTLTLKELISSIEDDI